MVYDCGWSTENVCYAESGDGQTWTPYSGNPIISNHGGTYFLHYSGTYYIFTHSPGAGIGTQFDEYTSSNGVTWTLAHANVLGLGSSGAWDSTYVGNAAVWVQSGTWYMLYDGVPISNQTFQVGLATASAPGGPWTKYSGNPVITPDRKST